MAATACILEALVNTQALCSTSCEPYVFTHRPHAGRSPTPTDAKEDSSSSCGLVQPPSLRNYQVCIQPLQELASACRARSKQALQGRCL